MDCGVASSGIAVHKNSRYAHMPNAGNASFVVAALPRYVHGVEDRLVPVSWAERAHKLMKNSKIEIIPECGHLPPVEQPDLFNRIVRGFLSLNLQRS